MSTLKVNAITDTSGGTNVDVPNAAKAWVNFNGTGTVAIRADYNVSSITDLGTANYEVNFAEAMPDINYCALTSARLASNTGYSNYYTYSGYNVSTSKYRFVWYSTDSLQVNVAVFR